MTNVSSCSFVALKEVSIPRAPHVQRKLIPFEPLGLLAGLHEFPTVANISGTSATAAKVAEIPDSLLKDLLADPPLHPYSGSKSQGRPNMGSSDDRADDDAKGAMGIVHVKPAGDVVHVFSHIRKTYRVQWVLLKGGGDEPPKLLRRSDSKSKTKGKGKAVQKGKLRKGPEAPENSEAAPADEARWVPLDQVEHAKYVRTSKTALKNLDEFRPCHSIGTGVMKVWKLVRTLW